LHDIVTQEDRENADTVVQVDARTTEGLVRKLLVTKEVATAAVLFSTSNFSGHTATYTGTNQWSDRTNSNPIKNIIDLKWTVKKASGFTPNTITMGRDVWNALMVHSEFIDRVKHTSSRQITIDIVKGLFEVENIYIGESVYDSTNEGQTATGAAIWGKHCLLSYKPPRPDAMTPSTAYTFAWKVAGKNMVAVDKWFDRDIKGDKIEVEKSYVNKITAAASGYLIYNAVA
jgi:hypothetical protein